MIHSKEARPVIHIHLQSPGRLHQIKKCAYFYNQASEDPCHVSVLLIVLNLYIWMPVHDALSDNDQVPAKWERKIIYIESEGLIYCYVNVYSKNSFLTTLAVPSSVQHSLLCALSIHTVPTPPRHTQTPSSHFWPTLILP